MELFAINNQPLARSCPLTKPLFLLNQKWHIWQQPDQPENNSKTTNENYRKNKKLN